MLPLTLLPSPPIQISTLGSAIDTLLAVYTGNTVSGLTVVTSNDDCECREAVCARTRRVGMG
jgi:hypothetical protein